MAERAQSDAERLRASQLAPEGASGLAVERPPDGETAAHHRVRGNEPPRRSVEVDLDAPARPFPQCGDDCYCYSPSDAAPTSASAAAAAAAFASLPLGSPLPTTSPSS